MNDFSKIENFGFVALPQHVDGALLKFYTHKADACVTYKDSQFKLDTSVICRVLLKYLINEKRVEPRRITLYVERSYAATLVTHGALVLLFDTPTALLRQLRADSTSGVFFFIPESMVLPEGLLEAIGGEVTRNRIVNVSFPSPVPLSSTTTTTTITEMVVEHQGQTSSSTTTSPPSLEPEQQNAEDISFSPMTKNEQLPPLQPIPPPPPSSSSSSSPPPLKEMQDCQPKTAASIDLTQQDDSSSSRGVKKPVGLLCALEKPESLKRK